nr:Uncharacterised protein [Raoultella sp. NCTC 9187]
MPEAGLRCRAVDGFSPLAGEGCTQAGQLLFQVFVQTKLVVDDDALQIIDAAFHVIQPWRGTRQLIGGADVEHHKAVEILEQRFTVKVGGQQIRVTRLHPAVAAHVEVPAFFGGDDADVFTLRFRAFTRTAGHAKLHLMRRTDAFIAVLQLDAEAYAVAHRRSGTRCCRRRFWPYAGLWRTRGRFKARFNQLTPDFRQIVFLSAKHADTLRAGDFGVEVIFARDAARRPLAFRRDFAACGARDNRVGPVFLDIGEEAIVGLLQRRMLRFEDVLIPAGGQQ